MGIRIEDKLKSVVEKIYKLEDSASNKHMQIINLTMNKNEYFRKIKELEQDIKNLQDDLNNDYRLIEIYKSQIVDIVTRHKNKIVIVRN